MTEMLKGIAASDGVAVAKAYLLVQPDLSFETVTVEDTSAEEARLDAALAASQDELSVIREKAVESLGEEAAAVFDAHLMVLADPEMTGQIKETIRAKQVNAEAALTEVTDMFIAIFEGMEDNPYMQERAADIRDVTKRVLANLLGKKLPNPASINEEVIVIAHDLTPSDTAQLNKNFVKAFVTNIGGRTSHSAIMARTLEIAAVLGTNNITELVKDGDILAVSGITGEVVINPTEEQIAEFKAAGEAYAKQKAEWAQLKDAQTVTADGKHFELAANIGTPKDVEGVNNNGAEAVGLYRTEFLYMENDELPAEDVQFEEYKKVAQDMKGKPVIIRTMDIGGDKELKCLDLPSEMNPFLGYRAIRISLNRPDIFKVQLRALLRASAFGDIHIMYPMIASVEEVKQANAMLDECKKELTAEGKEFNKDIKVGIMIEVPAAAVISPILAKYVDFFSIGTNDLCQYTLAVDRMNESIGSLYQPLHPGVLRLIKHVIDASHEQGKFTGMCGELASDPVATMILLGLGLDEFSMTASSIPLIKNILRSVSKAECEEVANKVLTMDTAEEITEYAKSVLIEKGLL